MIHYARKRRQSDNRERKSCYIFCYLEGVAEETVEHGAIDMSVRR
jgi:hypothetical protein